jgi:phosphatidylglycerophosphatase A
MDKLIKKIKIALATGLGFGYGPLAPGSWGSAFMAVVCWWLLDLPLFYYLLFLGVILLLGLWSSKYADEFFSLRTKKDHDNKLIVIDEWVGTMVTMLPLYYFQKSWLTLAIGLFLFRAMDTAKFGLAKFFDNHHSRWGVMLDDFFAGLHATIIFSLALWIASQVSGLEFIF